MPKNLLCFICKQSPASQFCACNIKRSVLCNNCIPTHFKGVSKQPHFILPLEYQDSAKDLSFLKRLMSFSYGKEALEGQVATVQQWKNCFSAEAEQFQNECRGFQEKVETSFDKLNQSLRVCVDEAVHEVKTRLRELNPSYANPMACEFWSASENLTVLKQINDASDIYETMRKRMKELRLVFQVKYPKLLAGLKEESFVMLKDDNEVKAYQRSSDGTSGKKQPGGSSYGASLGGRFHGYYSSMISQPVSAQILMITLIVIMTLLGLSGSTFLCGSCLSYTDPGTTEILARLGLYNEEQLANMLIKTGPIELEAGYYKGHLEPNDKDKPTHEHQISGYGSMAYHNGDTYEGYWKKGQRHGSGRLATAQGDIYEGVWVNGEFSGWGNCTLSTGVTKSGHWQGWKLHGFGHVIDGISLAMGEFVGGKMSGFGLQYRSIYNFTLGMWHNETLHGRAFESRKEGFYMGNYQLGHLHGNVTMIEASGVRYVGEWERGMKEGKGVESYPAEFLAGQWTQGSLAQGEYHYMDSYRLLYERKANIISEISKEFAESWLIAKSIDNSEGYYQGQLNKKHLRHGYGLQRYHNGLSYAGMWANGKWEGQGRTVTAQGEICEGMWRDMEFTGWGSCKFSDGAQIQGQWEVGKMEGFGYTRKQNKESFGTFKNGILRGIGMQYEHASAYSCGNWLNGKLVGPGIEYNNGVIRFRENADSPAKELRTNNPPELCIRRKSRTDYPWSKCDKGNQAKAVTFYVDKPVFLTAISIGNARSWESVLEALQILQGRKIYGSVVYNHSIKPTLKYNFYMPFVKIPLEQHVFLNAGDYYTILVKYSIGSEVYYDDVDGEYWTAEGGLYFTFSRTEFNPKETENGYSAGCVRDFYFMTQT